MDGNSSLQFEKKRWDRGGFLMKLCLNLSNYQWKLNPRIVFVRTNKTRYINFNRQKIANSTAFSIIGGLLPDFVTDTNWEIIKIVTVFTTNLTTN